MKKILIALVAVLSVVSASAQFKVEQTIKAPEVVWSSVGGHQRLYAQKLSNGEYYFFLGFNTTNNYDDKMLIHLGKYDKTKATLSQLLNDFATEETYNLSDDRAEPFTLFRNVLGEFVLSKRGYAGKAYLTPYQIRRMLDCLNNE